MINYREFAREIKKKFTSRGFKRDEDGRALVEISVDEKSGIYAPYSLPGEPLLSGDFTDMITSIVNVFKPKTRLHFVFYIADFDPGERAHLKEALVNTFTMRYSANIIRLKRNFWASIALFVTAVIFLIAMALLLVNGVNAIVVELVDIAGWVFMWEAVNEFFIERSLIRIKEERTINIIGSEITFEELNKK